MSYEQKGFKVLETDHLKEMMKQFLVNGDGSYNPKRQIILPLISFYNPIMKFGEMDVLVWERSVQHELYISYLVYVFYKGGQI